MQLVIIYHVTDGCTYGFNDVLPVEYSSAEAFLEDFMNLCEDRWLSSKFEDFEFAGHKWNLSRFFDNGSFYSPEILTVREWFLQKYPAGESA